MKNDPSASKARVKVSKAVLKELASRNKERQAAKEQRINDHIEMIRDLYYNSKHRSRWYKFKEKSYMIYGKVTYVIMVTILIITIIYFTVWKFFA